MQLTDLHARMQQLQAQGGSSCHKRGGCDARCCRFDLMNGEPSVTAPEIALIDAYLAAHEGMTFSETGNLACKFLGKDGLCKIYQVRPIDCRIHFCADQAMSSGDSELTDQLVFDYHNEHAEAAENATLISSHVFRGE